MSRSRKDAVRGHNGKGLGWEYWARRPFSGHSPGSKIKKLTHRKERRIAERELRARIEEEGCRGITE
jgi:hypothetical protein